MNTLTLHANCIADQGRGLLILGASGAGKSALSLQMMAYGAQLVSDDRTVLSCENNTIFATSAPNIGGLIEARGIGILHAPARETVSVFAVVDLGHAETERLPLPRETRILDISLPLIYRTQSPAFAAALLQYLRSGRKVIQ